MPLNIQTLMPAAVTPNSQTFVTDIDGDTINELIIFDNTLQQLSVVHQFKYTDFTLNQISPTVWPASDPDNTLQIWKQDTATHWRTMWTTQFGSIPVATGVPAWTIGPGDAVIVADFDGNGADELFIYNLETSLWGLIKWDSNAGGLQMFYQVSVNSVSQPVPPNGLTWVASTADQYIVVPDMRGLVGTVAAKEAGLLLYNSETVAMAMISYSPTDQKFLQWWHHTDQNLTGNWNLKSSNPPCNKFYPANFASAGVPSVLVYDTQDHYLSLLQYINSDFTASSGQGGSVGNWGLSTDDQVQCADLDGDEIAEVLTYSPSHQYIGVLKWNGKQFDSLAVARNIGTAPNTWTVGSNDQYYCVSDPAAGSLARIFAYSASSHQVGILTYDSTSKALECEWVQSTLGAGGSWPVGANDLYYAALSSNTTKPTLFTMSNQGPASKPAFTLGAIDWNGAGVQIDSTAPMPAPSWSVGFLADAPATAFTPFTDGNQPAIYTYINNLFPLPGQPSDGKPIRSLYTVSDDKDKFQPFAAALSVAPTLEKIPSYWPTPGTGWSDSDWKAVWQPIVTECNQVDTTYTLFGSMATLVADLNSFQEDDLKTLEANIDAISQPPSVNSLDYWGGQVGVMLLWGLAAAGSAFFPGEALAAKAIAWGVGMSMFASIAGSAAGYDPTQQKSYDVAGMELAVVDTLVASILGQSAELTAILQDPVKLQIVDGLHDNEWDIDTSLPNDAHGPFTTMDRISMYQKVMPYYFTIVWFWPNVHAPIKQPPILWMDNGECYGLKAQKYLAESDFQDLYNDLFTTLGVSLEDFFLGNGGWSAIPRGPW